MGEVVISGEEDMDVVAEVGTTEETPKDFMEAETKDGSSEVVRWEKFLPRMVLRVLLVEADDSTRQIISALLRKCSYRVAAVPDGLMAWETLKGRPQNIDLILTEVELPSISGYALLTLVMEHDICKNIPVIMMSSQDSISMVLKCMLKGAADFLIKPVRRNELKNLWQHVWRRQALTAGHIPQSSPIGHREVEGTSENNATSNHSSDCAISSQKNNGGSERGSDAESSCTTPYLEAESAQMQTMQGLSQPMCRSTSNLSNTNEGKIADFSLDKKSVTPESQFLERLRMLGPKASNGTAVRLAEEHVYSEAATQDENMRPKENRTNANIPQSCNDDLDEPSNGAIDLIGAFDNGRKCNYGHASYDGVNKFEFNPQLELSLKRLYPSGSKNQGVDERHALNHSNASAFSRYNSKTLQSFFPASASNCTDSKVEVVVGKSSNQLSQNVDDMTQQHGATVNGNNGIMTSLVIGQSRQAEVARPSPQHGPIHFSGLRFDDICNGYSHVYPPVSYSQSGSNPNSARSPKLAGQREDSPFPASASVSNPEIQDSQQKHRQSDETANNYIDQTVQQKNKIEQAEEQRYCSPATGQSSCSSLCNGGANNSSAAYGSFGSGNEKHTTLPVAADKAKSADNLNDGNLHISDGLQGLVTPRSSQREAALTKFRLKRKERCYEKKVRYQSRKRLAEQRPRVKGQFVRQVQADAIASDASG